MLSQRMTATSVANLQAADKVGFYDSTDYNGNVFGVMVWVEKGGRRAFLSGSKTPLIYKDRTQARRAVKRLRPDLEPTDI